MVVSELTASAATMMKSATPAEGSGKNVAGSDLPPLQNRAEDGNTPFLRGYAQSPIAWQLLDQETVDRAAKENKLIFLHIGFKACHFCRLMSQESFSNSDCASIINESFIPVLVDREARPDIDTIYMNYVQAVSNSGGWPLNLFLTPQLEPVFGGTYWPGPASTRRGTAAEDAGDEPLDFLTILRKVNDIWKDQQARCRKEAAEVVGQLREFAAEGTLGTRTITAQPHQQRSSQQQQQQQQQQQKSGPAGWPSTQASLSAPSTAGALASTSTPAASKHSDAEPSSLGDLDLDQLEEAYTHIAGTFDPVYGGFGLAPKFLTPPKLHFLLSLRTLPPAVQDVVGVSECRHAVDMAVQTLRKIRDGALHDHVGRTGFSRCSVTPDWSIPNFEKLVVDNASLLALYLEAWRASGAARGSEFFDVVAELADYLSSEPIALPDGGFASSEAADSRSKRGDRDMREGAYYLWSRREFDSVVDAATVPTTNTNTSTTPSTSAPATIATASTPPASTSTSTSTKQISPVAAAYWGVLEDGNVDEDHDPNDDFINLNILRIRRSPDELAAQFRLPRETVLAYIATAKRELKKRRDRERQRPEIDDKIVAGHSGLVVSALANTAAALEAVTPERSEHYLKTAGKAVRFLRENMWDKECGVLYRIWSGGRRSEEGFADDYAYLISGLLDLHAATRDESHLEFADILQRSQTKLFYDPPGAFFSTTPSHAHSILRLKDGMDTSLPSTNAVAASNLFRLGALLADDIYAQMARDTVSAFEAEMLQHPWLYPGLLSGVVSARPGVSAATTSGTDPRGAEDIRDRDAREKA